MMHFKKYSQIKANQKCRRQMLGASLVEFVVVAPTLLFMILGVMQTGLVFHAKSNLNYAAYEAARTGTVSHSSPSAMMNTFKRAMVGYYGGGRTTTELAQASTKAFADITPTTTKIEILSPTKESFDDYASPKLATRLGVNTRVIPNTNIAFLQCPIDKPSCNHNPASNASGQTLQDANLLKIKITYGIPPAKQIPLVGRFYVKVLQGLNGLMDETSALHGLNGAITTPAETDVFKKALLAQGRIPMVVYTTMRMQSEAFENSNASSPGAGNGGTPVDPNEDESEPPNENDPPVEEEDEECDPLTDLFGCRPAGCKAGDPSCDPICEISCCTGTSEILSTPIFGQGSSSSPPLSSSLPSVTEVLTGNGG
jgi:hypothetical protein